MRYSDEYKSTVPEGMSGSWSVKKFTVSEEQSQIDMLRSLGHAGRYVPPGSYTQLLHDGSTVMSDTPDECHDFREFEQNAKGHVLINGLGLGVCTQAVLRKPEVTQVTVIEIAQDVINLVAPYIADPRLAVICADAYTWEPPKAVRYGAVWHDIWSNLCTDNLKLMTKLHRKYGKRCEWQGSWCRDLLQWQKRRETVENRRWGRW